MKISIIIPLYNAEKYIKKCLDSVINQTYKNIEIILINDASKDSSIDIVNSYQDKRIKIINNKKNMGIGYTRNIGLKNAIGEYIVFVDSDDYIDKNMCEDYLNFVIDNNLDMLNSNYYKVFYNNVVEFKVPSFSFGNIRSNPNLINLINHGPTSKLFKKSIIDKYDIKFSEETKYEDFVFVAKYISYCKKIGYLDKSYYYYLIHGNSETTTVDERVFDIFKVLKEVNNIYSSLKDTSELDYLNITEITRYMLKQKYQNNISDKKKFINEGYKFLNDINKSWRNNVYYKKEPLYKRIIKNHKTFLYLYCIIGKRSKDDKNS